MDRGPATVTQVAAGAGAITKAAPEALNEYSCPVLTTINVIQLPIAWHLCMPFFVKCQECFDVRFKLHPSFVTFWPVS